MDIFVTIFINFDVIVKNFNFLYYLLLFIIIDLFILFMIKLNVILHHQNKNKVENEDTLLNRMLFLIENKTLIRIFNSDKVYKYLDYDLNNYSRSAIKSENMRVSVNNIQSIIHEIGFLLLVYILKISNSSLKFDEFYFPYSTITNNLKKINNNTVSLVLNYYIIIKLGYNESVEVKKIDEIKNFDFKNISVKERNLNNFNLTIKKREKIVIVGPNGSGKTSFLHALLKINKFEGKATVNGEDINEVDYYHLLSYVSQKCSLFDISIYDNLVLEGKVDEDYLMETLKRFNFPVEKYNLHQRINENFNMSQGEVQLINVIRCLLKQADLYIFDEPTNNLDKTKVKIVFESILNLNDTVIVCTHNNDYLDKFDHVFYFN
ncbi:LCNC [Hepatospora eriocheir]|uniref:LCNC n=1 Tax=Hepatospora eriocheir TaxID=1081669 RepID=A0A1X0Q8W3_9MICR|nr:LCNC [Hepatospora eriocheir]